MNNAKKPKYTVHLDNILGKGKDKRSKNNTFFVQKRDTPTTDILTLRKKYRKKVTEKIYYVF